MINSITPEGGIAVGIADFNVHDWRRRKQFEDWMRSNEAKKKAKRDKAVEYNNSEGEDEDGSSFDDEVAANIREIHRRENEEWRVRQEAREREMVIKDYKRKVIRLQKERKVLRFHIDKLKSDLCNGKPAPASVEFIAVNAYYHVHDDKLFIIKNEKVVAVIANTGIEGPQVKKGPINIPRLEEAK